MSDPPESAPSSRTPGSEFREFALWALASIGLRVEHIDRGFYLLHAPLQKSELFHGARFIRFRFDELEVDEANLVERPAAVERLAPGERMFLWLRNQLDRHQPVQHSRPIRQPASSQEVMPFVLQPFKMDGGRINLQTIDLVEKPLLRLTYIDRDEAEFEFFHRYVGIDGSLVDNELITSLELGRLQPSCDAPWNGKQSLDDWVHQCDSTVIERLRENQEYEPDRHPELITATVIWCQWAAGQVTFGSGLSKETVAFEGWAQHYVDRLCQPPPFTCSESGKESYHVASTDDGFITVAEEIGICSYSKRRVRRHELAPCEVSGDFLLPEFLEHCPVTGKKAASTHMAECDQCGQRVCLPALSDGSCATCLSLVATHSGDAIIARVLAEYPELSRWSKWWKGESFTNLVLCARSFAQRVCYVLDKDSLAVVHVARKPRFWGQWQPLRQDEM